MKKILSIAAGLFLTIASVFAEETSPWAFSLTTDLAYYPLSAPVDSAENHFAPITGPYKGLESNQAAAAMTTTRIMPIHTLLKIFFFISLCVLLNLLFHHTYLY